MRAFFLSKGAIRLDFISFSVLYYRVTKFLNTFLKIRTKDTMKAYFLLSSYVVIG